MSNLPQAQACRLSCQACTQATPKRHRRAVGTIYVDGYWDEWHYLAVCRTCLNAELARRKLVGGEAKGATA